MSYLRQGRPLVITMHWEGLLSTGSSQRSSRPTAHYIFPPRTFQVAIRKATNHPTQAATEEEGGRESETSKDRRQTRQAKGTAGRGAKQEASGNKGGGQGREPPEQARAPRAKGRRATNGRQARNNAKKNTKAETRSAPIIRPRRLRDEKTSYLDKLCRCWHSQMK